MNDETKVTEFTPKKRTMADAIGEILDLHKSGEINKESAANAALFLGMMSAPVESKKETKTHEEIMKQREARSKL